MEKNHLDELLDHTKEFVNTKVEIVRLQVIDKTSRTGGLIASHIFFLVICISVFFFLSISGALYIGEVTGKNYFGFLAMGVFFGLTGLLFYWNREKWIRRPFADTILRSMLRDSDHEQD